MQLFVHHHLGMGDHIICNRAIRTLAEKWSQVFVFARENNYKRVVRMFSDDPKISVISIPNAGGGEVSYIDGYLRNRINLNFIRMGFSAIERMNNLNFDQVFYACAGVPFENRWDRFKINRNKEAERAALAPLRIGAQSPRAPACVRDRRRLRANR
jgi:hypothetical protein